jgi:hypothetical protein
MSWINKNVESDMLTFKLILNLNDNWEEYKKNGKYEVRDVEIKEVEKMLGCMDVKKGYTSYICEACGEIIYIPHSCKSRICSTCGKRHADEWAEKINSEMYAVPYRHIILTVLDKLWSFFEGNSMMQKVMLETAAKVMKEIVLEYNGKNKEAEPGIIMVLHPFGRDLKTNMHVHMLMTEGGLTKKEEWISMPYIDYRIIRKKWQYGILTAMRKAMPGNSELNKIIDWCFKERTNGFNIQAKRRIEGKTKQAARYMARYVRHPAIADSRIIGYDTKNVIFKYERDGISHEVIMDKYEFIHSVIKHIPDANFKMVRYYGIHARRAKKRVRKVMGKLGKLVKYVINSFSWRKHIIEYTGKDPLQCTKCGGQMKLFEIAYCNKKGEMKKYGGVNLLLKKLGVREVYELEKEAETKEKEKDQCNEKAEWSQLCMF